MIEINYLAMALVTLTIFALGAVWYSPLMFGKTWMKIMGCEKYTKEELQAMQKKMGKFYLLQFAMTLFTVHVLYNLIHWTVGGADGLRGIWVALFMWLGFVMPTQVSGVIWGNTEKKWWGRQLKISLSYSLFTMLFAGYIFSMY